MALQSSGQISLADLAAEYGGSAPHSMSEYYRSGAYVSANQTNYYTAYQRPRTNSNTYLGNVEFEDYSWNRMQAYWSGSRIRDASGSHFPSFTQGNYTYFKDGRRAGHGNNWQNYLGRYYTASTTTSVNTNVPSSGQVSITQYYGQGN
jgi:hypothetical protein